MRKGSVGNGEQSAGPADDGNHANRMFTKWRREFTLVLRYTSPYNGEPRWWDGIEVYAGTQLAWIIESAARGPVTRVVLPVTLEVRLPALVAVAFLAKADRASLAPRGEVFRRVAISHDVLFRR